MQELAFWRKTIENGNLHDQFGSLYPPDQIGTQQNRYLGILTRFEEHFGSMPVQLFSVPGRVELSGNHTDHNNGRVLAAGVNLDAVAVAAPVTEPLVTLYSKGYPEPFRVDLGSLERQPNEEGSTTALIRGIAARLQQLGFATGGFCAEVASDVLPGSGLSSSAAIEVLIATLFNHFYNEGKIAPLVLAQIGQFAENHYFGKPCGLMDQVACAVGGIVSIDFAREEQPEITRVDFDFAARHYSLIVLDTGGNHADLTEEYASVPEEMRAVARALGAETLRRITLNQVMQAIPDLRRTAGDRAVLRALHFFRENERVEQQVAALQSGDYDRFLELVNASGHSSWCYLQNCFTPQHPREQGVTLALALTEEFLRDHRVKGACRVHGGGFAGTILVLLPRSAVDDYRKTIGQVFAAEAVTELNIRQQGAFVWPADVQE